MGENSGKVSGAVRRRSSGKAIDPQSGRVGGVDRRR